MEPDGQARQVQAARRIHPARRPYGAGCYSLHLPGFRRAAIWRLELH